LKRISKGKLIVRERSEPFFGAMAQGLRRYCMKKEFINPMEMEQRPSKPFSLAVKIEAKKLLFVAGQTSRDMQGITVGIGDIRAQTRQIMENIGFILRAGGATYDDIAKITMFLADLKDLPGALEVRSEFLKNNKPASTAVQAGLRKDALIEIEVIAALD
jgi:enamine deaminase RidA (YjgF/YER057c/UK114 family)